MEASSPAVNPIGATSMENAGGTIAAATPSRPLTAISPGRDRAELDRQPRRPASQLIERD